MTIIYVIIIIATLTAATSMYLAIRTFKETAKMQAEINIWRNVTRVNAGEIARMKEDNNMVATWSRIIQHINAEAEKQEENGSKKTN